MTPGDGRTPKGKRERRGKHAWARGEGAASCARKQEDAALKKSGAGQKMYRKGRVTCICIPTDTPTRKGCLPLPDIWPPFFSRRVRLRFPTRRWYSHPRAYMRECVCMYAYVCTAMPARMHPSSCLNSRWNKGKVYLDANRFWWAKFILNY